MSDFGWPHAFALVGTAWAVAWLLVQAIKSPTSKTTKTTRFRPWRYG